MDDDELLRRLKLRDGHAQIELRKRMFHRLRAVSVQVLGDRVRAEDLAEDVLMDFAFEHVDRVEHPRAVASYLRLMAVRRACRLRTLQNRHETVREDRSGPSNTEQAIVEAIDAPARQACLSHCVDAQDHKSRQMLRLRFYSERSVTDIGREMGVSKQYVSRIMRRALEALRGCVSRCESQRGPRVEQG